MNKGLIIAALFAFITLNSFQCGKNISDPCDKYTADTILLSSGLPNIKAVFKVGDTIKLESLIKDEFVPKSGAAAFTTEINQLYYRLQPFSIIKNNALPELQYANIEFNPIVVDGQLLNINYSGYNYLYKRNTGVNSLKIGFVAGKPGLYAFQCTNGRYGYDGGFNLYRPGDNCTNYWGITNFTASQKNLQYWDSLGVAAVSLPSNYGTNTIAKNNYNYFFFKVIP